MINNFSSTLNFFIEKNDSWDLTNSSINIKTTGRPYYMEVNQSEFEHHHIPLKITIDKINLFMLHSDVLQIPIKLNHSLNQRLIHFIVNGRPDSYFDCHRFIAFLFDKYDASKQEAFDEKHWKLQNFNAHLLTIGTVVYLRKANIGKHSALYVGDEQYISLFGDSGGLIVANLQEMMKLFEADNTCILTPL